MNYNTIPSQEIIEQTLSALVPRNIIGHFVQNKEAALAKVKELLPEGAEVMTGSSKTLEQIGFIDLLKTGQHPWHNLKDAIVSEKDPVKQGELRKQSVLAKYFLGSVHALTQDGRAIIASASGSQIPSYAFTSENVIWVVGAQKIVPTLDDGFARIREYVFPLENERMKSLGMSGSTIGMELIMQKVIMPNHKINLVLVNESLGF